MAFQANAFQSDAFQISASQIALQRRRRKGEEELARERYLQARRVIEEAREIVETEKITKELEAVVAPFEKEGVIDMELLLQRGQAKRRLEQILISIRRLEDELLEMLALLLLANEAL